MTTLNLTIDNMKKITLGVVALTMTIMSFGQSIQTPIANDLREQNFRLEQVIDAIRMDMYYGHLEHGRGTFYINELLSLKIENETNIVILTRLENE
tara:strand:- start:11 stop:298 length:288 start_codon:yes stop_codon:yes gene_type:complete